jgi:hypothetical protein
MRIMRAMIIGRQSMGLVVALIVLWACTTEGSRFQASAQGTYNQTAPAVAATQAQMMIKPRK